MKQLLLAALLAGGGWPEARGGPLLTPDSTRQALGDTAHIYLLPEVVTSASRSELLSRSAPSPITVISREDLRLRPGSLAGDALAGVPELVLRPYGGASALETVSLRGMGPENTLVLIDGQRANSYQNGELDLGFLSSANIERIEVAPGGYSSLYGADAVGGVISITTRNPPSEALSGSLQQSLGSEGYQATEISLGGSGEDLGFLSDFRRESGRGDYAFDFSDGQSQTRLRRNGNDFELLSASAHLECKSESGRTALSGSYTDASRGVANTVSDPSSLSRARLGDQTLRSLITSEQRLSSEVTLRTSGMLNYAREHYLDPGLLIGGQYLESDGITRTLDLETDIHYSPSSVTSGSLGIEFGRAWFEGTDLHGANRYQRSAFLTVQQSLSLPTRIPFELLLFPSLRYDGYSDMQGELSPKLGLNLGVLREPDLRLRASFGRSYRVPTFNDLYWIAGGNPDLKPERSVSLDAGFLLASSGDWKVQGSFFHIRTRDRIVWRPTSGTFWSPENLGEVGSDGFECEGAWNPWGGRVRLSINSTWMSVVKRSQDYPGDPTEGKQLIYVPRQTVNARATIDWSELSVTLSHAWSSFRYTTENNDRYLPAYSVASAAVTYRLPLRSFHLFAKLEVTNLFNTAYEVIALYPMPLREMRMTLGGEL